MPVPKRKRSRARRDSRFANKFIKVKAIATCSNCNEATSSHQVCASCGYYKGRKVMTTKKDRVTKRKDALTARQATSKSAQGTPSENPE